MILTSRALQVSPLGTPELSDTTITVPPVMLPVGQFSEPINVSNIGGNPGFSTSGQVFVSSAVVGVTAAAFIDLCSIGPGFWELYVSYLIAMSFPIPATSINNSSNENALILDSMLLCSVSLPLAGGWGAATAQVRLNLGFGPVAGFWQIGFRRPACIAAQNVTVHGTCIATKLA